MFLHFSSKKNYYIAISSRPAIARPAPQNEDFHALDRCSGLEQLTLRAAAQGLHEGCTSGPSKTLR
jgi:hypothetical protein